MVVDTGSSDRRGLRRQRRHRRLRPVCATSWRAWTALGCLPVHRPTAPLAVPTQSLCGWRRDNAVQLLRQQCEAFLPGYRQLLTFGRQPGFLEQLLRGLPGQPDLHHSRVTSFSRRVGDVATLPQMAACCFTSASLPPRNRWGWRVSPAARNEPAKSVRASLRR